MSARRPTSSAHRSPKHPPAHRQPTQAEPLAASVPAPRAPRSDRLDLLRGIAMLWMAVFHACFDLSHFGLLTGQNFYADPLWTLQRMGIVSLFLFTVGAAQAAALQQPTAHFWRRWAQIAGCALLVSAGSYLMFPQSWISFGVLHAVAVMLLLLRLLQRAPNALLLLLALVALALPQLWQHAFFDSRATWWLGLVTHKPRTEDFVPVLPWLGVVLLGFVAGRWLMAHRLSQWAGAVPRVTKPLLRLSRWPLSFYMLHQPVLIGLVAALAWWLRQSPVP